MSSQSGARVGIGELALVDQEPDLHVAPVHRVLDLVEGHHHRLDIGLVEPEREPRRGESPGTATRRPLRRVARIGRAGPARETSRGP